MSKLDKLQRIIAAKENEEQPLVETLKALGWEASRTTGGSYENMTRGDVMCFLSGSTGRIYSFEIQFSPKHTRMSWSAKKVSNYRGHPAAQAGDVYCILGCQSEEEGQQIFILVSNTELLRFLEQPPQGVFLNGEGSTAYYVITPETLVSSTNGCVVGSTIQEVITTWNEKNGRHPRTLA